MTIQADDELLRSVAAAAGLEFVSLTPEGPGDRYERVNPLAVGMLSEQACRNFGVVSVSYREGVATVATSDPFDQLAAQVCATLIARPVRWVVADAAQIATAIDEGFVPLARPGRAPGLPLPRAGPRPDRARRADGQLRVGELLRTRGLTSDQIDDALAEQRRTGSRLGEILVHNRAVSESELAFVLSDQLQLGLLDVSALDVATLPRDIIPEPLSRHLRCVPIAVDGDTLELAVADAPDDDTIAALREHTSLHLRALLATPSSLDELLRRMHADAYLEQARGELLAHRPEECASRVLTGAQKLCFALVALALVVLLVLFTLPTLIGLVAASAVGYTAASLYKFKLMYSALEHEYEVTVSAEEVAALDERTLPLYTILVPLYHEAAVLPRLVEGIGRLDYPKTKLDVRLLCEEDDGETIDAVRAMALAPHFKLVVIPDAQPKTKPKACNYGLLQAQGEIVVIYDAEDRPDADQLKRIVVAFRKANPRVTCIQAKLNYFNRDQNLLTRWFSIEYSMWFELILPGLDAENVPIPLGGTSNHFLRDRLAALGAWDPFNVTEDADLGIRLHKAGYQTAIIDSTTLEEANSELHNWIRQRSRWIKGYIQTWLVHMRHPWRLLRQLGPRGFISFQLLIGGTFIFLLNPIFWFLTTAFFFTHAHVIQQIFPNVIFYLAAFQLFIGNFLFMYLNVTGAVERRYFSLAKYALFSPIYWGLMSVAAWKGFIQLIRNPFYWEKTEHGLTGAPEG